MSLTIQGLVITVLTLLVQTFDLDIDEGYITELVTGIITVVGLVVTYVGRVRIGDITWYGKRK